MANQLIQILTFTNVAAGQQATLAHNLNENGTAVKPDIVERDNADFSIITVTTTAATVRNDSGAPATLNLWIKREHSIARVLDAALNLSPQPFVPAAGVGTAGSIVVYDGGVSLGSFTALRFDPGTLGDITIQPADEGGGLASITIDNPKRSTIYNADGAIDPTDEIAWMDTTAAGEQMDMTLADGTNQNDQITIIRQTGTDAVVVNPDNGTTVTLTNGGTDRAVTYTWSGTAWMVTSLIELP